MNVRLISATTQLIRIVCTLHAKAVARRRAELKAKAQRAHELQGKAAEHFRNCQVAKLQACDALTEFEAEASKPITLEVLVK